MAQTPLVDREIHRREMAETIRKWQAGGSMKILTYSLVGLRADCDFMLWRICYSLDCMQEMAADVSRTRLGGYLELRHNLLGMTRRSVYAMNDETRSELRGALHAGGSRYLHVYPLVRTRPWYLLPFQERQRMVHEITKLHDEFPDVRVNVAYSFGLGEQDFIVVLEGDRPEDFLERTMRLKETDSGPYVQSDTPSFTCVQTGLDHMLEQLG
ncbi:MAG TPA: chlorite dismutase family protein [Terriglobales bacterium]|nr:chlorite dismutase family protein [Terriglobales bacterium]